MLEIIGEKTVADVIMDRLVQYAHRIELMVDSMKKAGISSMKPVETAD